MSSVMAHIFRTQDVRVSDLNPTLERDLRRLHLTTFGALPSPMAEGLNLDEVSIVTTDGGKLAGHAYGYIIPPGDMVTYALSDHIIPLPQDYTRADREGTLGFLDSMAIAPDYRGYGLGAKMTAKFVSAMADNGATAILTQAWKNPTGVPLAKILEKLNFRPLAEIDKIWENDAPEELHCPYCGPKCRCGAVIYGLSPLALVSSRDLIAHVAA
jgi:ribosomal protein S18 acetylase RimI-like enzyme